MGGLVWGVVVVLVVSSWGMAAPPCSVVTNDLEPCLAYIQGNGEPTEACCGGVKEISDLAKTKDDRVAICECGKSALIPIKYNPALIPPLPGKCGVQNLTLPPIDSHTDCTQIP